MSVTSIATLVPEPSLHVLTHRRPPLKGNSEFDGMSGNFESVFQCYSLLPDISILLQRCFMSPGRLQSRLAG